MDDLERLQKSAGAARVPARAVLRVRGDDPLGFLHAVTTQDVATLAPGQGALACLLDDKGRVLAEFRVLPLGDGSVVLDGQPAIAAVATKHLSRIAPLSGCEVLDESALWSMVSVRGPDAVIDVADIEHAFISTGDRIDVRVQWESPGFDVLARQAVPVNADPVTFEALEALRIIAGRPRYGIDVTEEMLINETPLLARAVSFTKGCYPGQESVARVHNLGRVRRVVAGLECDTDVAPGDAVTLDGTEVGTVTSAARGAAISYVRTEAVDAGHVVVRGAGARARRLD